MQCNVCNSTLSQQAKFCPECGTKLDNTCICGTQLSGSEKFCPNCGTPTSTGGSPQPSPSGHNVDTGFSPYSQPLDQTVGSPGSATVPRVELHSGAEVGNYVVDNLIGQGGFAGVYKARDTLSGKDVALKVLPFISRDFIKNIILEFESRDKIKDYDHILRAWQPQKAVYGSQDIILYPMELADQNLRRWLNEHRGNSEAVEGEGLELFKQACRGVEAIHLAGLTHLDLKPENILLTQAPKDGDGWIVKVADFGLARGMGLEQLQNLEDGAGTPHYMAPEQIQAARWKDVTKAADIYALGSILFEMIDGDLPYSGTPQQIKTKKRDASIAISKPNGPQHLAEVAMACLEREKDKRLGSASKLTELLDKNSNDDAEDSTKSLETGLHPDFINWVKERLVPDRAIFGGHELPEINTLELLNCGGVNEFTLEEGKLFAVLNKVRLICLGNHHALAAAIATLPQDQVEEDGEYYLKLYLERDTEKARYELEKVSSWKDGGATYSETWVEFAASFHFLFEDSLHARRCLKEAETKADDASDWCSCAENWKSLFADDREARRCLTGAESKADYAMHLCRCAEYYKALFADDQEVRRCLKEAESISDGALDWYFCIETWQSLLYDDSEARRCLKEAESISAGALDWCSWARNWKSLFEDEAEARRCLKEAEAKAKHSFDWGQCADTWKKLFADDQEVERCRREAENA